MKLLIKYIFVIMFVLNSVQSSNENEQLALEQLRPLVVNILTQSYMKDDSYLLPFLRAVDWDIEKAADMIRNTMKWRTENRIDGIIDEEINFQISDVVSMAVDRSSRPVIYGRMGRVDIRRLVLTGTVDVVRRYIWKSVETMLSQMRSMNSTQVIGIMDLNGVSARKQGCLNCVKFSREIGDTFDVNYPGFVEALIFINTPRFFEVVVKVAKAALPSRSAAMIHVYGYDQAEWTPVLLKWIAPDQLRLLMGTDFNSAAIQNEVENFENSRKILPHNKVSVVDTDKGDFVPDQYQQQPHSFSKSTTLIVNLVPIIIAFAQIIS